MNTKRYYKTGVILFLILSIIAAYFLIQNFNQEKNVVNSKIINRGYSWENNESRYAGSELSFSVTKSNYISFQLSSASELEQGVEIFIDGKSYIISSPNLSSQRLTVYVSKKDLHSVVIRYFCVSYGTCHIKLAGIFVEGGAKLWPFKSHNKVISILGDSISTIYGKDNYTQLLADDMGYELHDASTFGETMSKAKGFKNAILSYKKDLLTLNSGAILIFIGTNDASQNIPIDNFEKNYSTVLKSIKEENPDIKVFLVGLLPREDLSTDVTQSYSNAVENLAHTYGYKYIDPTPWLLPEDFVDGIHPGMISQKTIADNLYKIIKPDLK